MSESWIKMRVTLHEHPHVVRIAYASDAYGRTHAVRIGAVVGLLHRTWSAADAATEDGFLPGYTAAALDAIVGVPGWTEQLVEVGWARVTPAGIELCDYSKHNGTSAKRRANEAERQRRVRKASRSASRSDAYEHTHGERSPSYLISSTLISSGEEGSGEKGTPLARALAKCLEPPDPEVVKAAEAWDDHAREKGNPMTERSWMTQLQAAARDPRAWLAKVQDNLEHSTWTLKDKPTAGKGPGVRRTATQAIQAELAEMIAEDAAGASLDATLARLFPDNPNPPKGVLP